jgi:long-chain acyl-CoA synthetase
MATRPMTRKYAANPVELTRGTLAELFFEGLERQRADAVREHVGGEWRSISHAEIEERVRAIAAALPALGIERGDRVAILSENRPEWAQADYGMLCSGILCVPLYGTLPAEQVAFILQDSGARAIFVSTAEQYDKIRRIRGELPALEHVITFDALSATEPGVRSLDEVLELGRGQGAEDAAAFRERALEAKPDDVATILYTSGTTGQPKGVMLTHNNIASNCRAIDLLIDIDESDRSLSFLPLSHVFQRMVDYFLFWQGCTIAYVSNMEAVADSMVEVRPTVVPSVPRLYEKIYAKVLSATGIKRRLVFWARGVGMRRTEAVLEGRSAGPWVNVQHRITDRLVFSKLRARTGGQLRFFISGGAPLNPVIARFFYSAGILVLEGYGLTETSPVTNVNTPDAFRFGTVGKPVPGTEVAIAEDGEVLVRGPQVMKGYFNRPEATREVIDEDGWFHTGDVGDLDDDGYLRITDRKKELIVTAGGKNIAPQPIENAAKTSRFVAEAVVVGDRRPFPVMLLVPAFDQVEAWGQSQGLRWPSRSEMVADERVRERIEADVQERLAGLARFEMPKRFALLEEEFSIDREELTPTLKVRRRTVERNYAPIIAELYGGLEEVVDV